MTVGERLRHLKDIAKDAKILFVEDSDNVRTGTYNILKSFFHTIVTANDGATGLDIYKYEIEEGYGSFDIVITDIKMPKMSGLEMITEMKKLNPNQKTVVVSACEDDITKNAAKAIGVDEYIVKPIELENIIVTFTKMLES